MPASDNRDKPAEAVLRTILAKSDSGGRLVYIIRKQDGVESIEISTKAAAAKRCRRDFSVSHRTDP